MALFNKLPGFIRAPSGAEWNLFKKLPKIFFFGTFFILTCMLYLSFLSDLPETTAQRYVYFCFGLLFSHCFFVGAAFIGCLVVMIMKGPAYVADPYELPKENKKLETSL